MVLNGAGFFPRRFVLLLPEFVRPRVRDND